MFKNYSLLFSAATVLIIFGVLYGCEKDNVDQKAPVSKSVTEDFDTVAKLYDKG